MSNVTGQSTDWGYRSSPFRSGMPSVKPSVVDAWSPQYLLSQLILFFIGKINNQSIIPSTDVIQLTLTLKMTTTQVVETSVTVNNNSPFQDYVHPDDQTQPTFEMTPGFKPFTIFIRCLGFAFHALLIGMDRKKVHVYLVNGFLVKICLLPQLPSPLTFAPTSKSTNDVTV